MEEYFKEQIEAKRRALSNIFYQRTQTNISKRKKRKVTTK
jgi:hypothetical protein